jgi:MFS family permease
LFGWLEDRIDPLRILQTALLAGRTRASGLFTVALFGGQFLSPLIASAVSEQVGLRTTFIVFAAALLATAAALLACGRLLR